MSKTNGARAQEPNSRAIVGATTFLLVGTELEQLGHQVQELRHSARSLHLPLPARNWITEAADLVASAIVVGRGALEALEEKHPEEARVAGEMAAQLEARTGEDIARLYGGQRFQLTPLGRASIGRAL